MLVIVSNLKFVCTVESSAMRVLGAYARDTVAEIVMYVIQKFTGQALRYLSYKHL